MQLSEQQIRQQFEQWWLEPEGFGLRAERFTTPGEAARAAWNQAMSLRAQADARPVATVMRNQVLCWLPGAPKLTEGTDLFTYPVEAAAPGLSDELTPLLNSVSGDCYMGKEWEEAQVKKLRALLTRASAATVAEPSDMENEINEIWTTQEEREAAQRSRMQERFANRLTTPATADFDLPAPNDAAQQQAEPGADERAACEAAWNRRYTCVSFDGFGADYLRGWIDRAAQSSQRAGVARDTKRLDAMELGVDVQRIRNPDGWRSRYMYGKWIKQDFESLREAIDAAAPTQQQEGGK